VLARQSFRDYELCISDDCSTDGRSAELEAFIKEIGLPCRYRMQPQNARYDKNLRTAINMATGRYCLLMGNDDCLAADDTLGRLHAALEGLDDAGVLIANYAEYEDGKLYSRARGNGRVGAGPDIAIRNFRNFSFVSGIVLRTDRAQAHSNDRWDGAEMYQMFLGCRIIAEGYGLIEFADIAVRKSILVQGETVDSYAARAPERAPAIKERRIPLVDMGRLVFDAVRPYCGTASSQAARRIVSQIIFFTYPFWVVEYRRVQSWQFAAGISLGMRPRNLLPKDGLSVPDRVYLHGCYLLSTVASLLVPRALFTALRQRLYVIAKTFSR